MSNDTSNPFIAAQNPPDRFNKITQEAKLPPLKETVRQIGAYIDSLPKSSPKFLSKGHIK